MKVLQINSVIGYGSTGKIVTDLYDFLQTNGHNCLIAYGMGTAPLNYQSVKVGNDFDFFYHRVYSRLLDRHGFASKTATKKLIKTIETYQPDIIHLHNIHGFYLNINILFTYLKLKNIPVVWLLHDQWAISGHSANFDLNPDGTIPTALSNRAELKNYPISIGLSQFKRNLKDKQDLFTSLEKVAIITPSMWLNNIMKQSFLNQYAIKTFHNGINTKVFNINNQHVKGLRKQWDAQDKVIVLGVASVWDKRKGLEDFIHLANRLPTDSYQIVLVGIDRKISQELPANIICIERTNSVEKLVDIYNASDIFVNLTYFDNFPTVNIEALACGTPVITYDTGGSSESIDENTGSVVSQGDLTEIVRKIEHWHHKSNETRKACRSRATHLFHKDITYSKYLKLYSNLLSKNFHDIS